MAVDMVGTVNMSCRVSLNHDEHQDTFNQENMYTSYAVTPEWPGGYSLQDTKTANHIPSMNLHRWSLALPHVLEHRMHAFSMISFEVVHAKLMELSPCFYKQCVTHPSDSRYAQSRYILGLQRSCQTIVTRKLCMPFLLHAYFATIVHDAWTKKRG